MKMILGLVVALVMVFFVAGCGASVTVTSEKTSAMNAAKAPGGDVLTKEQWKAKMDKDFKSRGGMLLPAKADKFKEVMGLPASTQTVGDKTYWYYVCSDGQIQVVLDTTMLKQNLLSGEVNDY